MTGDVSFNIFRGKSLTDCSSCSIVHSWSHHLRSSFCDILDARAGEVWGFGEEVALVAGFGLGGEKDGPSLRTSLSHTIVSLAVSERVEMESV